MNSYTHDLCPLCHWSYPASALPAHLAAHGRRNAAAAAARAADLKRRSNKELVDMLRIEVWAELDPVSQADMVAIVEEIIDRLEAMP